MIEPDRRYLLRAGQGYFLVGAIDCGRRVIIWHDISQIHMLLFDSTGKFKGRESVPLSRPAERGPSGIYRSDAAFEDGVEDQTRAIKLRLSFVESDILIQSFSDEEGLSGVDPMPMEYQEFLETPDQFNSEEQESFRSSIREWVADGCFVLNLGGSEYWMSADGKVWSHW